MSSHAKVRSTRSHGGQPFGEHATMTGAMAAKPLAHAEFEPHTIRRPGQIREGPFVVAVNVLRGVSTLRTRGRGLGRAHRERDLGHGGVNVPGGKA